MAAFASASCCLDHVLVAATERGICLIALGDGPAAIQSRLPAPLLDENMRKDDAAVGRFVERVVACIETSADGCDLPLDIRGTPFQRRVWNALREIPAGTTATYAEIAQAIGRPRAVRAVAAACAANRLAVVIPCHRVIRSDGELGGYRWGIERKRKLLERETNTHRPRSPQFHNSRPLR